MFYYYIKKRVSLLKEVLLREHNKQIEKHFKNMFIN